MISSSVKKRLIGKARRNLSSDLCSCQGVARLNRRSETLRGAEREAESAEGSAARESHLKKFTISGGNDGEVPPVPIPNTEVKLSSAESTWLETAREDRSLPDPIYTGALMGS